MATITITIPSHELECVVASVRGDAERAEADRRYEDAEGLYQRAARLLMQVPRLEGQAADADRQAQRCRDLAERLLT